MATENSPRFQPHITLGNVGIIVSIVAAAGGGFWAFASDNQKTVDSIQQEVRQREDANASTEREIESIRQQMAAYQNQTNGQFDALKQSVITSGQATQAELSGMASRFDTLMFQIMHSGNENNAPFSRGK